VIVTRKAASLEQADAVVETVMRAANIPSAIVHLDANELRSVQGDTLPAERLRGKSVLAVSAIGDPSAFGAQLAARGATVASETYRDHHRFTPTDAATLSTRAMRYDLVVCTLKDVVKLGPLWPGPSPLWYVSQRVDVERGEDAVDTVVTTTLLARSASTHPGRPGSPRTT
jgi:tetraacyldisaccharide 4'-kinase